MTGRLTSILESLEDRRLFSVSINSNGFSVFAPDGNSIAVFVSSSTGSDKNTGLSANAPVASLAKAYSLVRNGHDDQILLKRGDTWGTTFGQWQLSGVSHQSPMFIGTYGSGNRPVVNCGYGDGFQVYKNPVNYVLMQGIQFTDNLRDPTKTTVSSTAAAAASKGFELLQPSSGFTIDDCSFTYFSINALISNQNISAGAITNLTIRRCLIANSYCTSGHSQGLYAAMTGGFTLDQDVFDHNGWNTSVSRAGITGFNHDIYGVSTALGMVVTNCIVADASATGVMARGGGKIDGNLFLNDAIGVSFGEADGATSAVGGVVGEINNNVFMDNHQEGSTRIGQGIDIGNTRPGAGVTVSGNIFANDDEQASSAITLDFASGTTNPQDCVGINDLTVSNNITYGWLNGLEISPFDNSSPLKTLKNLTITGNQFQSDPQFLVNHQGAHYAAQEHWSANVYYSTKGTPFHLQNSFPGHSSWIDSTAIFRQQNYPGPTRSPGGYNATLGGTATLAAFMTVEDSQSDRNWNSGYTTSAVLAYLQAGFSGGLSLGSGQISKIAFNPTGHTVDVLPSISIAGTGIFDVTNNALDIASALLATVTNQVRQGDASGSWTGVGITSSTAASASSHLTAVGVIQNNQGGSPAFGAGKPFGGVTPGAADILVKYTYYGDANLDGKVDNTDYICIASGYLSHATGWFNGDFNYDGIINGSDYALIDNACNTQGASLAAQVASPANKIVAVSEASTVDPWMTTAEASLSSDELSRRFSRRHLTFN